jgi:hypothetical protein
VDVLESPEHLVQEKLVMLWSEVIIGLDDLEQKHKAGKGLHEVSDHKAHSSCWSHGAHNKAVVMPMRTSKHRLNNGNPCITLEALLCQLVQYSRHMN